MTVAHRVSQPFFLSTLVAANFSFKRETPNDSQESVPEIAFLSPATVTKNSVAARR